jgi:DNA-binding NtrC family response regulator
MNVLVIDDDPTIARLLKSVLTAEGFDVTVAYDGDTALELAAQTRFSLVFSDVKMGDTSGFDVLQQLSQDQPDCDIVLMTGHASLDAALDAVRYGARDYIAKPFDLDKILQMANAARKRHETEAAEPPGDRPDHGAPELIGRSPAMIELFTKIARVATTDLPVLVIGESGTGKEVVARKIHATSRRGAKPFVAINCGALPETLLESELFGHVRGSFTGAVADRRGLFEEANGGTLLLDEITETTPAFQVKLLRVLQEGEIRRVGASHSTKVDVRVLAATNRNVEEMVSLRLFREDLYFRLNAVIINIPTLRDREGDVDLMIGAFLSHFTPEGAPQVRIAPEALASLKSYPWPGNVRELRHVMQRLSVLNSGGMITLDDLPERIRSAASGTAELAEPATGNRGLESIVGPLPRPGGSEPWPTLDEVERQYLLRVLEHTGGNKSQAAEILGVDRKTLRRMIARFVDKLDGESVGEEPSGSVAP